MFFLWYRDPIFITFIEPDLTTAVLSSGSEVFNSLSFGAIPVTYFVTLVLYKYAYILINSVIYWLTSVFSFKLVIANSVMFALKFLVLIALMIFIRGGIPRYRYDFLTKLGWIKFLGLILSFFLLSLLLTIIP